MAEEQEGQDHNDGTWSSLKKTIVGTLGTVVAGGGVWLSTLLFGGGEVNEQPVQSQPNIIINNTQQQQQQAPAGKTVVIKEVSPSTSPAKPAEKKTEPKKDDWTKEEPKW